MEMLLRLDFWDWLAFGTVLLLLEIFGAGGYLLRVGLTAAVSVRSARSCRDWPGPGR